LTRDTKQSRNKIGYKELSDTPDIQLSHPFWNPQYGPNATETQATQPEASGIAVAISAVIKASGIAQTINKLNPHKAKNGPVEYKCKLTIVIRKETTTM
jgi:hypothetical protein